MSVLPPTASGPTGSVSQTASAALGVTGGASVLIWVMSCLQQGHLVMPDTATAMIISASIAPLTHAIYNLVLARLARIAGVPTSVAFNPPPSGDKP